MEEGPQLAAVTLPAEGKLTPEWVVQLAGALDTASRAGASHLKTVLPPDVCAALLDRCQRVLHLEPTLLEVRPPTGGQVNVVGDTHGQYHDVCRMFEVLGNPSPSNAFVINGDFVDRGAWGLETLVLYAAWKLALPGSVFLLRGNHESATCTLMYGFKGELVAKYGRSHWRHVYASCKRFFASLPLSAHVGQHTLVLHGGLFRRQPQRSAGKHKRKRTQPQLFGLDDATLGGLDDLRRANKGGMDPNGLGASRLAADVLWSDPVGEPGFQPNVARGVGMVFGPDVTERFLAENGLRLVLRSHEGPDAREGRDDMGPMTAGWTLDHDTPAGKLMTVFSAPDYPQFMPEEAERYQNLAAVAVLTAPDWATPDMRQFAAAHPRPEAQPYYDLFVPDSDEEFEPAASTASGMTGVEREGPAASTRSCGGTGNAEGEEVEQQQAEQVQQDGLQQQEQQQQEQQQAGQQEQQLAAQQQQGEQQPEAAPLTVACDALEAPAAAPAAAEAAVVGAAAAAGETSSGKSEETAEKLVEEPGAEGSSPGGLAGIRAPRGRKENEVGNSPRKRGKCEHGAAPSAGRSV
ncbi:Serine threonine-phosphatase 7 [Micractinium conductrix]|uniref:Serine/threonine-protein phosphatase n=1 Tax=Micractinium conductrix TaxID=554055 RepID=A0A2P6VPA9_9CHLO|nr:Serine threonine-phosphatase 7 [Micractinium conductrix]|eukprot:PSC75899.1 Serine threonine-phosphatase 7 [Micractinium conductrix]